MRGLAALTVASISFHVLMEWLFFVTKPSFLTPLSTKEKALIPWVASAPLLGAALALLLVLALLARTGPRAEKACLLLARGVPALILAATLLQRRPQREPHLPPRLRARHDAVPRPLRPGGARVRERLHERGLDRRFDRLAAHRPAAHRDRRDLSAGRRQGGRLPPAPARAAAAARLPHGPVQPPLVRRRRGFQPPGRLRLGELALHVLDGGPRRIPENAQDLDVAPTLLDALGIEAPSWMGGVSLLRSRPDPCRWIVSARYNPKLMRTDGRFRTILPQPPWYTLGSLSVISGSTAIALDLPTGKLETSRIEDGGDACPAPAPEKVRAYLMEHLRASGYQVR